MRSPACQDGAGAAITRGVALGTVPVLAYIVSACPRLRSYRPAPPTAALIALLNMGGPRRSWGTRLIPVNQAPRFQAQTQLGSQFVPELVLWSIPLDRQE
jgi:hypothetical protein